MSSSKKLSHLDETGSSTMVDISDKQATNRRAEASCRILLNSTSYDIVKNNKAKKGNVLEVARIAGIMAGKKTAELIPLCHQINLSNIGIIFTLSESEQSLLVSGRASTTDKTGVEMEALVATSVASLTVYDMLKSVDKNIKITDIVLDFKDGGKSGTFIREKSSSDKL